MVDGISSARKMARVRTPPIAVVGENLVDLLVAPDGSLQGVVGGGPLNVARTIARLGGDVRLFSGVSADAFGGLVRDALEKSKVRLAVARAIDRPTTLAVVELDPGGPRYYFHLTDTASFAVDALESAAALASIANLSALYFGTLGLVVEPMASWGEAMVGDVPEHSLVVIDPNCRPSAVRDAAQYRARVERLASRADVLKVSTEDLAYLHPWRSRAQGARTLLDHGAKVVVVSDGASPVRVMGDHMDFEVAVTATEVADTVGAGDALVGGLLTWWTGHDLSRGDLGDASTVEAGVRAAIEISRVTCQRPGAEPPWRDEARSLEGWHWL